MFQKKKDGKNLRFGCGLLSGCTFFMAFIFAIIALVAALIPCCTGSECDLTTNKEDATSNLPQNVGGVESMALVENRLPLFWATETTPADLKTYLEERTSFLKMIPLLDNMHEHVAHTGASGEIPLSEGQFREMCEHECKKMNSVNLGKIDADSKELETDRCYMWVLREDDSTSTEGITAPADKNCFLFNGEELIKDRDSDPHGKAEFKKLYSEDDDGNASESIDTTVGGTRTVGGSSYSFPDFATTQKIVSGFVAGNRYVSGDNFVVKTNKASMDVEVLFEVSETVHSDTIALRLNNDYAFIDNLKNTMVGLQDQDRMKNTRYARGFFGTAIADLPDLRTSKLNYAVRRDELEFGTFKVSSATSVPAVNAMTSYEPKTCPIALTSVRRLSPLKKLFSEKKSQKNNLRKLGSGKVFKLSFEMFILSDDAVMAQVNQQIMSKLFACQSSCYYSLSTGMVETATNTAAIDLVQKFEVVEFEDVETLGVKKMQQEIAFALSQVELLKSAMGAVKELKIVNDGTETVSLDTGAKISSKSYLKYMSQTALNSPDPAVSLISTVNAANTAEECRGVCANDRNCAAWEFDFSGEYVKCEEVNTICPGEYDEAKAFTIKHNPKVCQGRATTVGTVTTYTYGLSMSTGNPISACKTFHKNQMSDEKAFLRNVVFAEDKVTGFMRGDAFSNGDEEDTSDDDSNSFWDPNPERKEDVDGRKPKCDTMRIVWITFLSAFCVFLVISAVSFGVIMWSLFKSRKEQNVRGHLGGNSPFDPYGASPEQIEMQQRWLRHKAMTRGGERSVYGSDRKSKRSESESGRSRSSKKSKRSSKSKKSKRSRTGGSNADSGSVEGARYVIGQSNPNSMVIGQSQPQVITLGAQPQTASTRYVYGQPQQTTQYVVRNSSQPRVQTYSVGGQGALQQSQPVRLVVRNQSPSVYGQQPRVVSRAQSVA
jgi:hypothetical protein